MRTGDDTSVGPARPQADLSGERRCKRLPRGASREERAERHKAKMAAKAERRARLHAWAYSPQRRLFVLPAGINRHTGLPHENLRERARRAL